ncbi:MAG: diacylglycerol/lipid kinase family protein [Beutenbergiaceae bacterium]
MSRLGVVRNPAANGHRGQGPGEGVIRELCAAGHVVDDLTGTDAEQSLARARDAAHRTRKPLDALIVCGGDGMVHLGANALAHTSVPLGIVAVGSGNDFARSLGLPRRNGLAGLAAVLSGLQRPPRSVDLLRVDLPPGPRWVAGVISAGLDAAVNETANGYTFPPGGGKYIRAVAANLRRFRPYDYHVRLDGDGQDLSGTLVAVANAPYFGGGMRMAPDADLHDGMADVVLARALTRGQIARIFPRLYSGRHVQHPAVSVHRAAEISLAPLPDGVPPPIGYGDGERLGPLPMRIRVDRSALQTLDPAVP